MLFKKKNYLTRKYMCDKYVKKDKEYFNNKEKFIEFLNDIEKEFYNHDFEYDKRYACITRHRFLIDEMSELYFTKEQCKEKGYDTCPTVWCVASLLEFFLIPNIYRISEQELLVEISDFYKGKSSYECRQIYESYFNDGIISLNERDMILHALNMIKDSLKKCNDNLEWDK